MYIKKNENNRFVIYCDSQSAIHSIANGKCKHAMQIRILKLLRNMRTKHIVLEWIPSHTGIELNDLVDRAAKESLEDRYLIRLPLNVDEYSGIVKRKIHNAWQREWSGYECKYYRLKPRLEDWKSAYRDSRREEVVLSRLRTGACLYLVQHHLKEGNPRQDRCDHCQVTNTLEHLIIDCPQWHSFRGGMKYFCLRRGIAFSLNNVLNDGFNHNILFQYLLDIKFMNRI